MLLLYIVLALVILNMMMDIGTIMISRLPATSLVEEENPFHRHLPLNVTDDEMMTMVVGL